MPTGLILRGFFRTISSKGSLPCFHGSHESSLAACDVPCWCTSASIHFSSLLLTVTLLMPVSLVFLFGSLSLKHSECVEWSLHADLSLTSFLSGCSSSRLSHLVWVLLGACFIIVNEVTFCSNLCTSLILKSLPLHL